MVMIYILCVMCDGGAYSFQESEGAVRTESLICQRLICTAYNY